ncbi:hypothetical protein PINS_up000599 [Pythium insidiosum]|nr:hypothetical protein PINS_up000599 [Pythium insidiosum]
MIVMGRPMNIDYGMRDEATEKAREMLQQKLKKGVCHKFQSGECTRGDDCKFAHVLKDQDPEEMLAASASASGSTAMATTTTTTTGGALPASEATQAPSDAPVCINFQKGKCKRGAACRFQHLGASESPEASSDGDGGRQFGDEQQQQPLEDQHAQEEDDGDDSPVCLNFQKGKCKRGDKCRFRHAAPRAVAAPVRVPVPTPTMRAPVVYETQQPEDETPICQSYQQGKCKRGAKCRFRHVDAGEMPTSGSAPQPQPEREAVEAVDETPICQSYRQGKCKRGLKCRFRHVDNDDETAVAETVTAQPVSSHDTSTDDEVPICQSYLQGKCKRGLKCRFRHVDNADEVSTSPAAPSSTSTATESMETDETPICQSYQQGKCKRGAKCRFRHVDGDVAAATTTAVSTFTPAVLPEISICKNFTMGRCTRGASCRFAHTGDSHVAQAAPSAAHSEYQKRFQSICYNWQRSQSCARGDACPFEHDGNNEKKRRREPETQDEDDEEAEESSDDRKRAKKQMKAKKERRHSDSD